jgi:hypothetical protein
MLVDAINDRLSSCCGVRDMTGRESSSQAGSVARVTLCQFQYLRQCDARRIDEPVDDGRSIACARRHRSD